MRRSISSLVMVPLISACSVFGVNTVEEARYDVPMAEDNYELRLYKAAYNPPRTLPFLRRNEVMIDVN